MLLYRRSVGETEGKERKEGERRESESAKDSDAVRLHHVVSRKEMYDAHFVESSLPSKVLYPPHRIVVAAPTSRAAEAVSALFLIYGFTGAHTPKQPVNVWRRALHNAE